VPRDLDAPTEVGRDLELPEPPSAADAFGAGARRGLVDRLLSRAQALGAQGAPLPQDVPERSMAADLLGPQAPLNRPVDEARFETDRARHLQERRAAGAAAEQAHPTAYVAGEVAPAVATALLPGGAESKAIGMGTRLLRAMKAGAAMGGVQSVAASEADKPADVASEGLTGAAIGGAIGPIGELAAQGVGAAGRAILSPTKAFLQRAETAIADRSAALKEAIAKAAQGTAGAARANASRLVERLGMTEALPATEVAANQAALATPEATQLAQELAAKARQELPQKLAHMQSAQALAETTAQDAAQARSPEAVRAMEQVMRAEATKRLLTRYLIPSAVGAGVGEMFGGHTGGGIGIGLGLGARPMMRAIARNATGPAFQAPIGRLATSVAEKMAQVGGDATLPELSTLTPAVKDRLDAIIASLRQRSTPAVQLSEGRDLE